MNWPVESFSPVGSQSGAVFPPAPWHLHGVLHASLWRVPAREIPILHAAGTKVLSVGGQVFVATGWARYGPRGTLQYNELLAAVVVRVPGIVAPTCTIGPIWVDNEAAAEGGRSLWKIPKRLAVFDNNDTYPGAAPASTAFEASAAVSGIKLASLRFEPAWALPGTARFSLWTAQDDAGSPVRTRCALKGRLRYGRAHWTFEPHGPLGFLHGLRPLARARIENLSAEFGL